MRVKRLDICGFKSFMERVVFSFCDGVTGVVGPNGCGKSNVVDAIRWAMGEQSAKHLRGRSMEDVIFAGSESKPALGMAEVTITFYNDQPATVPVQYQEFSEISVTRRLFRSGESEYLINKTPCRLLDVTELFLGTGVGTKAYSIIEQGRIGLIVSSKPEDRRSLIEEAAGITRYKSRRKAAERKMEYTEQNLVRVGDITRELGQRLGVLEKQSRKAEKYKRLKSEMKDIELHSAAHRYLELSAMIQAAHTAALAFTGEEKELAEKVKRAEKNIESARNKLQAKEKSLREMDEHAHQVDNDFRVGEANLEAYRREINEVHRRMEEAEKELVQVGETKTTLLQEQELLLTKKASLDELATDDDRRLIEVRDELARLAKEEAQVMERLEQERGFLVNSLSRMATGKSQIENLVKQRADLEARLHRAIEEREALQQQVRELEKARIGCTEKLGSARQIKLKLEEKRVGEEEALERSRCGFMEYEARLIQLREELVDRRSRLNSLREIQKNYEGCGRGVRAIMRDAQLDVRLKKGVRGLISDVLRTPLEMERAVEAVLGERLQAIVVSDQKKSLSLINYLRETGEGRGIFIPLTVAGEQQKIEPDISVPGVVGAAMEHIGYESEYENLVRHLLGNVVLVKDLESAVAYSQKGLSHTVVTLDGEVIEPTGCMIGGIHEGAGVGTLNKKREMVELEEKVRAMENDLAVTSEQHRRLGEEIEQMEGVLRGLSQDSHSEALTVVEQEKDLHKATDDLSRAREQVEKLSMEVDVMQLALSELSAEETSVAGQSAQAESERDGREARVRKLSEDLSSLKAQIAELNAERTGLQVKVATDFERRDSSEKNLSRVEASLLELEEREERLQSTVKEAQARRNQLEEKTVTTRVDLEQWSQDLEKVQQERKSLREHCEEQSRKLEAEEARIRETRKNWEALQGNLGTYSLKERENSLELTHLCDSIRDRYAVELSVELYDYHMRKPPTPEMEGKLRDLREQVERMGEINLTAIEEHEELAKRHEFLKKQKTDLEQSLAQLKRAIVRINKTSKERFDHAFGVVNEKFQQVFPRLFNGGRAGLVLVPSEDGSDPGIEIMAQPPGKKLQSVNLLSGGEKALTAVALIFAIFLIKPTPFCLLDEVDAPLDDANVDRYNDLVREMSKISQFILITHNKRTMQIADSLYGVTMEEPGISKLVSVKMTEQIQAETLTATTA